LDRGVLREELTDAGRREENSRDYGPISLSGLGTMRLLVQPEWRLGTDLAS
jgi:hypothetical protein